MSTNNSNLHLRRPAIYRALLLVSIPVVIAAWVSYVFRDLDRVEIRAYERLKKELVMERAHKADLQSFYAQLTTTWAKYVTLQDQFLQQMENDVSVRPLVAAQLDSMRLQFQTVLDDSDQDRRGIQDSVSRQVYLETVNLFRSFFHTRQALLETRSEYLHLVAELQEGSLALDELSEAKEKLLECKMENARLKIDPTCAILEDRAKRLSQENLELKALRDRLSGQIQDQTSRFQSLKDQSRTDQLTAQQYKAEYKKQLDTVISELKAIKRTTLCRFDEIVKPVIEHLERIRRDLQAQPVNLQSFAN